MKLSQTHGATLVAVTKTRTVEQIRNLYDLGHRDFAENRVQELLKRVDELPHDIRWHLIGHLQTNKVRSVLPHVYMIQSLDREKLWSSIQAEAETINQKVRCLLQIKVAEEESKYGWDLSALKSRLAEKIYHQYPNVRLHGIMGMTTLTEDEDQIRREMKVLKHAFDDLRQLCLEDFPEFQTLSMGMSGDYTIALEEGSTMLRVGSKLFSA